MSNPVFKQPKIYCELLAWEWLISEAAYREHHTRMGNEIFELEVGQVVHSLRFMAQAWGWNKNKVNNFLKRLEKAAMIGTQTGTAGTLITICNYGQYQNGHIETGTPHDAEPGHQRDTNGTEAGQTRTKVNKGNEGNKEKPPNPQGGIDAPQRFVDVWHETVVDLPRIKSINPTRCRNINKRFADTFEGDIEQWRRCCERIQASDFLAGRETKWSASFDWVLKPANLTKIIEGNYTNKKGNPNGQRSNLSANLSAINNIIARKGGADGGNSEASDGGGNPEITSGFVGPVPRGGS